MNAKENRKGNDTGDGKENEKGKDGEKRKGEGNNNSNRNETFVDSAHETYEIYVEMKNSSTGLAKPTKINEQ